MKKHIITICLIHSLGLGLTHVFGALTVGTIPGDIAVDNTGKATCLLPLNTPPGTAGLQPKLGLAYSSRQGNSVLGMGWSINGLSAITRLPSTLLHDGFIDGVDFDEQDRFALDGQRLMLISPDKNYGDDESEYRTELESFNKVIAYGQAGQGPASFKVWTQSGLIMEYGATSDSRVEAQGREDVLTWALARIIDRSGNYVTFTYEENNATGESVLQRVNYTGNDAENVTPYNSIHFEYSQRTDSEIRFVAGSKVTLNKRLDRIVVRAEGTYVRDYRLTYTQSESTSRSLLHSIQEFAGEENGVEGVDFLKATTFAWQGGAYPVLNKAFDFSKSLPGASTASNSYYHSSRRDLLKVGDWDGDGKNDLLHFYPNADPQYSWVALSNGDGTFNFLRSLPGASTASNSYFNDSYRGLLKVGDWNGDGKTDLLHLYPNADPQYLWVALSNGDGTFTFSRSLPGSSVASNSYLNTSYREFFQVGDWNGDGRTDLLYLYPGADPVST